MKNKFKSVHVLSIMILSLTIIVSAGGLFLDGLYRDNDFLKVVWRTSDFVILIIFVPIFIVSIYFSIKGSVQARLILLGLLDFTIYNYGYYLFATAYNWFFLLYVALFVLSITAIIIALLELDVREIANKFEENIPLKLIASFMLFVSVSLTVVYTMMTLEFISTGNPPLIITRTEHPTNVVFAMDLSFVVPVYALGGIWLWKNKPWGYIVATASLVKGALYNLLLTIVTIAVARNVYPSSYSEMPLWVFFTIASLIGAVMLICNMNSIHKKN